ncbi:MAG: aminotransferase class IV [Gemmatimonadota bacterium]|nr:aminotransferase class IV [Gemmatimonadota bacterium]
MPPIVHFDGAFVEKDAVRISPDDRGFLFADGIYEVIRCYAGRPFEMAAHMLRLAEGLAALRIRGVDVDAFGAAVLELLPRNGLDRSDALIYLQVTRGAAIRTHWFPEEEVPPTTYAAARPFAPLADPARGVPVITVPDQRWTRCDIKSVSLLPNTLAAQEARERGAYEAILVRDGVALEGSRTNVFAVIDGVVRTAPLTNYILSGVTRAVVLEICRAEGIPCEERPILLPELRGAEEAFLASTTSEVLPIVEVDGRPVGSGAPGPVAGELARLFRQRVAAAGG